MKIFDIHTHNLEGYADLGAGAAQKYGIDRFLFLGDVLRDGAQPTPEEIIQVNDTTLADVRRHKDHARGLCYLNPNHSAEFMLQELERCFAFPEFVGIKLEISVRANSPKLDPLMKFLQDHNLFLMQHCWLKTGGNLPGESDPFDVAELARRFPRVRIIMAHLCGDRELGVEAVAGCPNVWIDTSGGQPETGFIEYAVRRIGARRLLYGSDAPCRDTGCQLAKVFESEISDADRELILSKNAEAFLKW